VPIAIILFAFSLILFGAFTERLEPLTAYINSFIDVSMRPKATNLKGIAVKYRSHQMGCIQSVNGDEILVTLAYDVTKTQIWTLSEYVCLETQEAALSGITKSSKVLTRDEALAVLKPGQFLTIGGVPENSDGPAKATYLTIILDGGFNISGKIVGDRNKTVVAPQGGKYPTNSNKPYPSYLYRIQKSPW